MNDKPYVFVAAVRYCGAVHRWRTAKSLKQALHLARRNQRAERMAWIEHKDAPATRLADAMLVERVQ